MEREDGRALDELRPVTVVRNFMKYAEGSVLIEAGDTKIVCTASVDERVPPFLRGKGQGWITAEYAMLPRATQTRNFRETVKPSGRSTEIQRFIGRCLRSVVDLSALGERTIWLDCDVLQADGGTRTAAITGAFMAMVDAISYIKERYHLEKDPVKNYLAAVSVGIVDGKKMLDLQFSEDSHAQVDMNVVMTDIGEIVEIQGAGEAFPFTRDDLEELTDLAHKGIGQLIEIQKKVLLSE